MNTIHYQAINNLLQITFSAETYRQILATYRRGQGFSKFSPYLAGEEYWEGLPTYLIAHCPFCASRYTAKVDTHSLHGWVPHPESYQSVYHVDHQQTGCAHFVGVETFVSLCGQLPIELEYYTSQIDVPFVTPTLLPPDISSIAVMHGLPICRLEQEQFIPRYIAFTITYYSPDPFALRALRRAENIATIAADPTFHPTLLYSNAEAAAHPESFDLIAWVRHKKLQWLDLSLAQLPLKADPVEAFPYTDIQGYRSHMVYRR